MSEDIEIELFDFFHLEYEDFKHNMVNIVMNDDIQKWIDENFISAYDINCDSFYNDGIKTLIIEFENDADALAFKLMWL